MSLKLSWRNWLCKEDRRADHFEAVYCLDSTRSNERLLPGAKYRLSPEACPVLENGRLPTHNGTTVT